MSTAITNSTTHQRANFSKTMFWRCVWKEFRMIRGLWLAVALIAFAIQCAGRLFTLYAAGSSGADLPSFLMATALAAAVLYTVGAAATTFAVEHEEETYGFLVRLPATWHSVFAGKLLVTLISSVLLATLLVATGWLLRGPQSFDRAQLTNPLSIFGFGIVEALAWGTLFSHLIKRPLLAAITTLFVGTLATTIAVNLSSRNSMAILSPAAYYEATLPRAMIVAAVFLGCLLVARKWLTIGTAPIGSKQLSATATLRKSLARALAVTRISTADEAKGNSRRRMLARLLWQTWRENWLLLLAPLGVALLLIAGVGAVIGLTEMRVEGSSFALVTTLLFTPSLYGAVVFYADQRRGNYRFLAEHAARPRFIWLARHIVWLGALAVVWTTLATGLTLFSVNRAEFHSQWLFQNYLEWGAGPSAAMLMYEASTGVEIAVRIAVVSAFASLVAYGVGQFFSMCVRSEILAGFLSLITALVVTAWSAAIGVWQLSPWQFLLPLFIGLMLATWLRAPDWIAGRNSWQTWWKPAMAIIAALAFVLTTLPGARLHQLNPTRPRDASSAERAQERDQAFANRIAAFKDADTSEAARTADMYTQAAMRLLAPLDDDPLKIWRKPDYTDFQSDADRLGMIDEDIVESKIPADQRAAFETAQKRQLELRKQQIAATVNEAIEISKRPTCRFHFDPSFYGPTYTNMPRDPAAMSSKNRTELYLDQLIGVVAGEPMSTPDDPIRRFLAALRMGKHFRSGQPTRVVITRLREEQNILKRISDWAQEDGRTKAELHEALDSLAPILNSPDSPADALLADRLAILDVIDGKQPPEILMPPNYDRSAKNPAPAAPPSAYLAFLANELPWERDRARIALDRITATNVADIDDLVARPREAHLETNWQIYLHRWLAPEQSGLPQRWRVTNPIATTSFLVSMEYKVRVPLSQLSHAYLDNLTSRRATILQLAIALYRLDHDRYPPQLADLVPEYLERLPLDPYSRQWFQYNSEGLNLPLRFCSTDGVYETVSADTPLIWSIGDGNARLCEVTRDVAENIGDPPPDDAKKPPKVEQQYEFVPDQQWLWSRNNLAFPLQKSEARSKPML